MSQNYRKIVFDGFDSLAEGLRICSERSKTSGAEIRTDSEVIAYKDGDITNPTSREPVKLDYCLIIQEEDMAGVEAKARYIINRLSLKKGDLLDSYCPNEKYTNAVFLGASPLEYPDGISSAAYLTLNFKADPILQSTTTVNERVAGFSADGNVTLTVTNNTTYSVNGGTAVSFTVQSPYIYRLVAYSENTPTVTLNGSPLALDTPFVMPSSAIIAITHSGFGWYELIHDTRQAVSA